MVTDLTPAQKVRLFNTTLAPAAVYVLGNLYPDESRATTLKKCRELDKEIRKILTQKSLRGRTAARAGTYLPLERGDLGLKSLELEVEVQYVRKGAYLHVHPDLEEARKRYAKLERARWRNPVADARFVLNKYGVPLQHLEKGTTISTYCKRIAGAVIGKQIEILVEEWRRNMAYGRAVAEEGANIAFPAHESIHMADWQTCILHAAAEEQLHGLGGIPGRRRACRRGCQADETAYHVVSACLSPQYNTRHDLVVWWIISSLLQATEAPKEVTKELPFGKATLAADYTWGERRVRMRAGMKIFTEARLQHNKPDVYLILDNPREIFILEISVSHIQNLRRQDLPGQMRPADEEMLLRRSCFNGGNPDPEAEGGLSCRNQSHPGRRRRISGGHTNPHRTIRRAQECSEERDNALCRHPGTWLK